MVASGMVVGICRVKILLPESQSLKERRSELRRLKELVRRRFPVAIAEVEPEDVWQSATLGVVTVGGERPFVESILERVLSFIDQEAKISDDDREIIHYGEGALSAEAYPHWEPNAPSPPVAAVPARGKSGERVSAKPSDPTSPPPMARSTDAPFPWELAVDDDEGGTRE